MLYDTYEFQGLAAATDAAAAQRSYPEPIPLRPQPVPRPNGMAVQLQQVGKRFGERGVLSDIALRIEPGEFVAIVGRSGCGKSTLLRLVAGLEKASAGSITLDGEALAGEQAQQGALAATAAANDGNEFAGPDVELQSVQYFALAEALAQPVDADAESERRLGGGAQGGGMELFAVHGEVLGQAAL